MNDDRLARQTGALAVLAGAVLALYAVLDSLQPSGCIGDACDTHPMRDTPTYVSVTFGFGGALLVASVLGVALLLRRRGLLGRPGLVGCLFLLAGAGLLVTGGIFSLVFSAASENLMPAFVVPGFGGVVLGLLLVAVAVLRSRLLPTPSVAWLCVSLLVLVFYNEQTWRVLLAVPFAAAWACAGVLLAVRTGRTVHSGTPVLS